MGTVSYNPYDYTKRQEIYSQIGFIGNQELGLSDFISEIEKIIKETENIEKKNIKIVSDGGFVIYDVRLETLKEYDDRISAKRTREFLVQEMKDDSWMRQKKRFAKAKAKLERKTNAKS